MRISTDSPYNTDNALAARLICSLPAAIKAALFPEETKYCYYVARKNGYHYFSITYGQHKNAIKKANEEVFDDPASTTTAPNIEG